MRRVGALGSIAALALAGCGGAPALPGAGPGGADVPKQTQSDETDRAALLAASCSGCHGAEPAAETAIPPISGQRAEVIQASLLAFRDGTRDGTLMPRLMRGYSDPEIELISRYLGSP